jgi:hypothetical protein
MVAAGQEGVLDDVHATWSLSIDMIRCEDVSRTARINAEQTRCSERQS